MINGLDVLSETGYASEAAGDIQDESAVVGVGNGCCVASVGRDKLDARVSECLTWRCEPRNGCLPEHF